MYLLLPVFPINCAGSSRVGGNRWLFKNDDVLSDTTKTEGNLRYIVDVKRLLIVVTVLVSCASSFGQNEPSLDKTIDYLASVLETGGSDQKILFGGDYRKEACRLFISDTITYALVKPAKVYDTEVQFHLGTIDPKTVKVIEKRGAMVTVELETTDYQSVIYESASKWKETRGRIPKLLELNSVPSYRFRFSDSKAADHFAKAFQHAVELCGGKRSAF